jgi:hypothetical protein
MPSNPETIIRDIQMEFDNLIDFVAGDEAHTAQVYAIEQGLLHRMLALGRQLLTLFLVVRARASDRTARLDPKGRSLPYHSEKRRSYLSIFGLIEFARPYFYARAVGRGDMISASPLDAELGLPPDRYSDLLREMSESLAVEVPYAKTASFFDRFFGLALSSRVLSEMIESDACDVVAFYQHKPAPALAEEGVLLVLQADGKGVPLVRNEQGELQKKEAIVTGLYTSQIRVRSAEDVVASFYQKEAKTVACPQDVSASLDPSASLLRPQQKHLWATLAGKDAALDQLQERVALREGAHLQAQIALCDGDPALQARIEARFPEFELILDFVHVSQYLWKAAQVLFDTQEARQQWVEEEALELLRGDVETVIEHLDKECTRHGSWRREKLRQVLGYFRRNAGRMDYGRYLSLGWPIASGVIEGACRHLVKDRCEGTGMRWTHSGAESLLGLRSVYVNGDWDAYHRFHRKREHRRRYGRAAPVYDLAEEQALKWAA